MAWKLMDSSNSRDSDLNRKLSACSSTSNAADFLRIGRGGDDAHDNSVPMDEFLRNAYVGKNLSLDRGNCRSIGEAESNSGMLLSTEITLLDAAGAVSRISDDEEEPNRKVRKTADEVWREIVAGKKSEQKPKQEMMTLEDFLLKAEEQESNGKIVGVKSERLIYGYGSSGSIRMGSGVDDVGGLGRGKRSLSLLEPLDKASQQRQRRMIKNRESAARSRERKQAYQVELEAMVVKLEEENERLLKEKVEQTKKRLKQLMENVIPIIEKQKPRRTLRKVHSMQW